MSFNFEGAVTDLDKSLADAINTALNTTPAAEVCIRMLNMVASITSKAAQQTESCSHCLMQELLEPVPDLLAIYDEMYAPKTLN